MSRDGSGALAFERAASVVTSVADVAGISLLPTSDGSGDALIAVCGMGLEILHLEVSESCG